jgi:hypothetical protein
MQYFDAKTAKGSIHLYIKLDISAVRCPFLVNKLTSNQFICFCELCLSVPATINFFVVLLHSPVLPLYVGRERMFCYCSLDFLDFVMRPPSNGECDKNNSVHLTSSDPTAVIPVSTICGNNSMVSAFEAQSLHLQQYPAGVYILEIPPPPPWGGGINMA